MDTLDKILIILFNAAIISGLAFGISFGIRKIVFDLPDKKYKKGIHNLYIWYITELKEMLQGTKLSIIEYSEEDFYEKAVKHLDHLFTINANKKFYYECKEDKFINDDHFILSDFNKLYYDERAFVPNYNCMKANLHFIYCANEVGRFLEISYENYPVLLLRVASNYSKILYVPVIFIGDFFPRDEMQIKMYNLYNKNENERKI